MNHEVHQDHEAIDRRTEEAARQIVDAGLKVHKSLGPGLLESAYEHCLAHELVLRGVLVRKQVAFPILYEGEKLDAGFLSSFFTYIVPTLGILAAQLSGTFRWALEPIMRVVK